MPNYRIPLAVRFWTKVDRGEGDACWLWTGSRGSNGYGAIRAGGAEGPNVPAHRLAYELLVGPIPDGLTIDHLCRTPLCVNPAHLEPVTSRENTLRSHNPTAVNARKTHCSAGHPLSGDNLAIVARRRVCRECKRATGLRHEAKRAGQKSICPSCGAAISRAVLRRHERTVHGSPLLAEDREPEAVSA